ncbi:MAG: replication-relaxation family protein [Actinomycetota bacterium]
MGRKPRLNKYGNSALEYFENQLLPIDRDIWNLAILTGRFSSHNAHRLLKDGASPATVERHLKKLYDDGMLLRYRPPRDRKEGTHPFVYQLSPKGTRTMEKADWLVDFRQHLKKMPTGNTTHLIHRLAANDAVIEFLRLECSKERPNGFRRGYFDIWIAQDAAETVHLNLLEDEYADRMVLRPDARMDVRLGDPSERVPIYLEVDRGTEKLGQIRRQIDYYIAAYLSDQWFFKKHEFPLVCWIFEKEKRAEEAADLMDWVMKDFRDPKIRSSLHGWTEVETDFKLHYFTTCITTKAAFYGVRSIAGDRIWRTNHNPERFSLEEIATIRLEAIIEQEKEKRLHELNTRRQRQERQPA